MANFVALTVFEGEYAAASISIAFPTSGNGTIVIETVSGLTIAGTTILSKIIIAAFGLNQKDRVYYSASSVATIVGSLGLSMVTISCFVNISATAAVNVAFPANGAGGVIIRTEATTIAGTTILSSIVVPSRGLNQLQRVYYSAATVAANVTLMG